MYILWSLTEKLLSLDNSLADGLVDTTANLDFVTIISGTIDQTVAVLDGSIDGVLSVLVSDLPAAKANEGHLVTSAVKCESSGHFF